MLDPGSPPQAVGSPGSEVEESPYEVLRNRDFLLYLIGRFIASVGQQMLTVAVGWELYERTHSALALGLVGLTQMVPMVLLTLPAGHAADNHNRQQILLLMVLVIGLFPAGLSLVFPPPPPRLLSRFLPF